MDSEHRIADNPHRCRTLGCGGTEGSLNLVGTHDPQGLDLNATRSGQFLQIAHRSRVQRIGWCPQHRQSLHVGHGFSQELQLLRSEIETEGRESGDVTAGTGQAGGQAELDGIAHGYHDDRKRARRLMCSTSRGDPTATMISTLRLIKSVTSPERRSALPSAHRYSTWIFCPST